VLALAADLGVQCLVQFAQVLTFAMPPTFLVREASQYSDRVQLLAAVIAQDRREILINRHVDVKALARLQFLASRAKTDDFRFIRKRADGMKNHR
jgi:hypothetical protein